MALLFIAGLGLMAGALTTNAGLGGGLLLILAISAAFSPATALAVTAPGLLVGNLHRLLIFRHDLQRGTAARLILGGIPGALLGALLAVRLPDLALHGLLAGASAFAIAKSLGWISYRPPASSVLPVGALAGFFTATSGGGGLLLPPALLALGLTGPAYLATAAAGAASIHMSRLFGYGLSGWMTEERWLMAAVLGLAIPLGNLLGRAARERLSETSVTYIINATLMVVGVLAVTGLG